VNIVQYYYTLKWLKWQQVAYRLRYRWLPCFTRLATPQINVSRYETIAIDFLPKKQAFFEGDHITFLNHSVHIGEKLDWNDPTQEKLWLYHLHYFDGLQSDDNQAHKAYTLLEQWVDENPPFHGNGWEPYPLSLRIVNIIKYAIKNPISEKIKQSLYLQARRLSATCEYHLLGNHLFENFKALCFAGLFFDTAESQRWFKKGFSGLQKEIPIQILSDGGHFELSPMYHSIILEGLLDLSHLFNCFEKSPLFPWHTEIEKMLSWLSLMSRPDNTLSYFNDTVNLVAQHSQDLFSYADALGFYPSLLNKKIYALTESGYYCVQEKNYKVIVDAGNVGPDYLPGHAHADTLSFEWYVDQYPVFVNLGVSCYGISARRLFERGTTAHNTLSVNDENSSEVWSGFRVARRARITHVEMSDNKITATHDGYTRLKKNLLHTREFIFSEDALTIKDSIPYTDKVTVYFHLHPDCHVQLTEKNQALITLPNHQKIVADFSQEILIIDNDYAIAFGKVVPTKTICVVRRQSDKMMETVLLIKGL
jgi:uncharacterized heparinase superfamily protein